MHINIYNINKSTNRKYLSIFLVILIDKNNSYNK